MAEPTELSFEAAKLIIQRDPDSKLFPESTSEIMTIVLASKIADAPKRLVQYYVEAEREAAILKENFAKIKAKVVLDRTELNPPQYALRLPREHYRSDYLWRNTEAEIEVEFERWWLGDGAEELTMDGER